MKWFTTREWSVWDIACLKWSCIAFGMIAGAYFAEFTRRHVWLFVAATLILAIRPVVSFFRDSEVKHQRETRPWRA